LFVLKRLRRKEKGNTNERKEGKAEKVLGREERLERRIKQEQNKFSKLWRSPLTSFILLLPSTKKSKSGFYEFLQCFLNVLPFPGPTSLSSWHCEMHAVQCSVDLSEARNTIESRHCPVQLLIVEFT
jgi:hypothetical protein